MKTKKILMIALLTCLALLVAGAAYLAVPRKQAEAKAKDWVGSWNVEITVVAQNATFPGFKTFYADGNLIADELPSPLETSGHGSWVRTGKNAGTYTFEVLVGNTEPGLWLRYTVNGQVSYDPKTDTWSGPFSIRVVDQDGAVLMDDTGTMDGTRIAPGQ